MDHGTRRLGVLTGLLGILLGAGCDDEASKTSSTGHHVVNVQISGEESATDGFSFPRGSEVTIADGWEIQFTHVLVTVSNVTLSNSPDRSPSDQSQKGSVVARAEGPWAIDLHREGTVPAAGGEGTAIPLATLTSQNVNGDAPFEVDQRYAFGFDIAEASADATKINFDGDAEAEAAYEQMIEQGYAVMSIGTATFKGTDCQASDDNYDFEALPTTVGFKLGLATPTSYINCQNQENQGDPFPDEEYQRGIPIVSNAASLAQITLHLEHLFYSDVAHEPALYFGQIAARLVGQPDEAVVEMGDLEGVDPTAFTDGADAPLPWRVCDGSPLPPGAQMGFEVSSVPVNPSADPNDALRDYADYMRYVVSTFGHLNGGEGLCFIERNYPSPP